MFRRLKNAVHRRLHHDSQHESPGPGSRPDKALRPKNASNTGVGGASLPAAGTSKGAPHSRGIQGRAAATAEEKVSVQKALEKTEDTGVEQHPAVRPLKEELAPMSPTIGPAPQAHTPAGPSHDLQTSDVNQSTAAARGLRDPVPIAGYDNRPGSTLSADRKEDGFLQDFSSSSKEVIDPRPQYQTQSPPPSGSVVSSEALEQSSDSHHDVLSTADQDGEDNTEPISPPLKLPELELTSPNLKLDSIPGGSSTSVDHTVHERPTVTHEVVKPHVHTVYHPVRTRSIHIHEHRLLIQPVIDTSPE